ncbi:extracellular solute-binding protein [Microbacterium indicum]|uniref:extracellular solute-binding protein n=1 Tax=Microbacterium indicum TaxID=358100 RepID=UPI000422BA7A|nr:extracellular solute-binding protein [Microbacterium indicum]
MQRTRTTLAIVAAGGLALSLVGCSSEGGGGDPDTIRVAYQKTASFTAMDDLMKKVKEEYEAANEGKTVELVPIEAEQDQYFTKLALMNGSADTAPDVIYEDTFQIRSDAAAGYLQPVDDYLADWDDWSLYDDGAKQAGVGDDGKTYGVSLGTDTRGIYFNKAILAAAGYDEDWQPESWDDLLDAARAVKETSPDVIPLNIYAAQSGGEQTSMQGFEMLLYGTGHELMDTSSGAWTTGSSGFLDALGFYQTVADEELGPDPADALDATWGSRVSNELLPQGEIAIAIDGSWLPSGWIDGDNAWPEWNDELGFAAMPTEDGGGYTSMSGGWTLAVGANADDPAAAFDVIKQAMTPENALMFHEENGQIAVRSDVAENPDYLSYNPSFEFFSSLVEYTHFRPATPDYSQISSAIPVATESVFTGQATPEDAQATYDATLVGIVGEENTQAG